ncbi:MAG TPA: RidA family protein [Rudaea sp.]|nr:RidA family protein [Rudaea sp.]
MEQTAHLEPVFHPFTAIPGLPFSEAVEVGDLLFLSGQIGTDANGKLVGGGIVDETRHALANISRVLARHGSAMERVVKVTVMLADMAEWTAMNAEYVKFFPKNPPSRSSFGCNGLAMKARVEIECVALRK